MKYKKAGVVRSSEISEISFQGFVTKGILLRSETGWRYSIPIGKQIRLVLPDGSSYQPKATGGETMTPDPGIVIELIPEIDNHVPSGSKVYVKNDGAESAKKLAFLNKRHSAKT